MTIFLIIAACLIFLMQLSQAVVVDNLKQHVAAIENVIAKLSEKNAIEMPKFNDDDFTGTFKDD